MSLKAKIAEEMKSAMKSGQSRRLETLRSLKAAMLEKEISLRGGPTGMTAEDELGVVMSAAKRRKESIEMFAQGGRQDLVDQETEELGIIQEYLPQQLGRPEIEAVVRDVIAQTGAKSPADFGKVMPATMKQLKGKADGKVIQDIVKELLAGA
jgi:uncharacterized protein YqeY